MDLYSDYLLSSFSKTTATDLSEGLDNQCRHDRITSIAFNLNCAVECHKLLLYRQDRLHTYGMTKGVEMRLRDSF